MAKIEDVWSLLETVKDPEIPTVSIVDLGIVRGIKLQDNAVLVSVTPTYSGCPALHAINDEIVSCLTGHGFKTSIEMKYSPPWTTDWMSEKGRQAMKESGIAPPACMVANAKPSGGEELVKFPWEKKNDPLIACPRCDSDKTEKKSDFGSTACKALYYCNACHQPFDYFKAF